MTKTRFLYIPAVSQREANARPRPDTPHDSRQDAEKHLAQISTFADPDYVKQLKVYESVIFDQEKSIPAKGGK